MRCLNCDMLSSQQPVLEIRCNFSHSLRIITDSVFVPASVAAVRVLYCVTITGIILSLALEAYQDFCKVPPPAENKAVEIVSFIAGEYINHQASMTQGRPQSHDDETCCSPRNQIRQKGGQKFLKNGFVQLVV